MKLILKEKIFLSEDVVNLIFEPEIEFSWIPGQFLQYYIEDINDERGNDRFFTIASSPLEKSIYLTTRISEDSSEFKKRLLNIESIQSEGPWGNFTLSDDYSKYNINYIVGGIGITPVRSMVKDLILNKKDTSNINILYFNRNKDFIFKKDIENLKVFYKEGSANELDFKNNLISSPTSLFYISGPEGFVKYINSILIDKLNINNNLIKKDFFPGYKDL